MGNLIAFNKHHYIEEAFKKGIEAEDDNLNTLAKKCCLSSDEVKIWVGHLHKNKETRAKAVRKGKKPGQGRNRHS